MRPFHEELKEIRLEKNISLAHIHDVTKIRVVLLEKIEEGDTSFAPAPIIRAFLREYAQVTCIDPERVIKRYENKVDTIRETEPYNTSAITEIATAESDQAVTETSIPEPEAESQREPEPDVTEPETSEDVSVEEEKIEEEAIQASETETPASETKKEPEISTEKKASQPEKPEMADTTDTIEESEPPKILEEQPPVLDLSADAETTSQETGLETPHRVPSRRSRLEIEEPAGANKLAIVIFVIIIIIAAAVVFWINN